MLVPAALAGDGGEEPHSHEEVQCYLSMKFRRRHRKELAEAIHRGGRLLSEARDEENVEFLEEATQRFPDNAELQLLYATALLPFRPDDVASEAAKAVILSPDDPVILVRAASLMLNRDQVRKTG